MPTASVPPSDQFFLWARQHNLDTMLAAIDRTARKRIMLGGQMNLEYSTKYTSSVANNFMKSLRLEPTRATGAAK